jgi:hypothetical protein
MARVHAAALAAHVAFLAAPSLAGRGLATEGLEAALDYVASSLALAEIPPVAAREAGGVSLSAYFQPVGIVEVSTVSGYLSIEIEGSGGRRSRVFSSGSDFLMPAVARLDLEAPLVFAGYGIREASFGHDDYGDLDVHGAVVIVLSGVPNGPQWQSAALVARYTPEDPEERNAEKLQLAKHLGAAALVVVEADEWHTKEGPAQGTDVSFFLPGIDREAELPLLRASPKVGEFLTAALGRPLVEVDRGPLAGSRARLLAAGVEREVRSRNVLAALKGSSTDLCEEAVVIGAHVDHLGRIAGAVYPGADDNASGVAAVLEIAKAIAASAQRPKRTIVFAFWTGEEEGKLGSGHYVRHPLWPLSRTVAYVNIDMIGHRFSLDEIRELTADADLAERDAFLAGLRPETFIEVGLPEMPPELADTVLRAARGIGVDLHLDYTSGTGGGSDYRDFARVGVPFLRFFGNFFPGYHEPSDTPEGLEFPAVELQARLALATVWLIADR